MSQHRSGGLRTERNSHLLLTLLHSVMRQHHPHTPRRKSNGTPVYNGERSARRSACSANSCTVAASTRISPVVASTWILPTRPTIPLLGEVNTTGTLQHRRLPTVKSGVSARSWLLISRITNCETFCRAT